MSEERKDLMVTEDGKMELDFASAQQTFCTFKPSNDEERVAFFNAVNSPANTLLKMVNMEIEVSNIYAETIDFVDKETGETTPGVRIVLISPTGEGYQASSKGVFGSVQKMLAIFGHPSTWKQPRVIRPRTISKGADRNVLVFDVVR